MAITRSQMLKELVPGLNALFGLEYARYGEEHKEIFEITSSERAFEEEVKLSGFGMEDNLYVAVAQRYTKALARAFANTKQVKGANVLNNGFNASYTGGDGKRLFATDHPLITGGSNSNRPTTGADLNETSLEAAIIQIAGWTDERGLLIAAKPRKLVVPPALMFVAERLLKSVLRTNTADNDINAIYNLSSVPEGYAVNHYLTDTNAWFLKTDVPNGLKMFERVNLKTSAEGDFETGNMRYKGRERYSFGWSDPLGMYGSPGAS